MTDCHKEQTEIAEIYRKLQEFLMKEHYHEKSPEVTFKYYMPENKDDVWIHTNALKMYSLLHDIDQRCRSVMKYEDHPEDSPIDKLAEEIRRMIREEIDLDMIR